MDRDKIRAAAEAVFVEVKLQKKDVIALLDALDEAEKENAEWEEKEAAVCPEDVGFEEYITSLQAENTRLRKALKASEAELQTTCYCCKLFKDCHLPCRLNNVREANKKALTQHGGKNK